MSQADTAVDEEVGNSGKGEKPGEDLVTSGGGLVDESQQSKEQLEDDCGHRSTLAVNFGQELRSHVLSGHGLNGTGRRICGRVCD